MAGVGGAGAVLYQVSIRAAFRDSGAGTAFGDPRWPCRAAGLDYIASPGVDGIWAFAHSSLRR